MRVLILFLLFVAMGQAAEPNPWPQSAKIEVEFADVPAGKLPRGLRFSEVTVEELEPHTIGVCWLDLNHDGTPELLIDSREGGSGGSYKHVFARTRSGFRRIAGLQGSIAILLPANGYYQFESWSAAGGNELSRMLYRYERGRYRLVRLEDWRLTDSEVGFEFVRSREPKG